MANKKLILGIETSCDETAAAVLTFDGKQYEVLSSVIASQIPLHRLTGGVVPEVAAREHVSTILPTIKLALKKAKVAKKDLDAIAVTAGPGLLPALMVGVDTANALSLALGIPAIPVQHITGHIYANLVQEKDICKIKFPLLALVVSGGHTEFVLMKGFLRFKKIGATLDDAAGEAFDKTAKMLGLPYPGGPEIARLAAGGDAAAFNFPRPLLYDKTFDFSFSGLKTAVLYKIQELERSSEVGVRGSHFAPDIAASVQEAIIDTLVAKTEQALKQHRAQTFTLGGGVSANGLLRERMAAMLEQKFPHSMYLPPITRYSTDNAVMIAAIGLMKLYKKEKIPAVVKVDPRWEI